MSVNISLNGDGLVYTGQIELLQATKIMAFIAQPEVIEGQSTVVTDIPAELSQGGVNTPARQFESPQAAIQQLGAKTNPHKAIAIALYLGATTKNSQLTTVENVLSEFRKAGEPTPKNIHRDLGAAVTDGYIYMEEKNSFRLLSLVDSVLENSCFPKQKRGRTKAKRQNTTTAVNKEVQELVKTLPVNTSLDGYIDLPSTKTAADKILWYIKYANANGIDAISRYDIFELTKKFGYGVDTKGFAAANKPNIKSAYIADNGGQLRLTARGEQHMKDLGADA